MPKLKPLIGSAFNAGFLPNAPGTWGSFIALFPLYLIGLYGTWYGVIAFTVFCSFLTIWVSKACEEEWGGDPSPLVMDEFAGQGMAFIGLSLANPAFNIYLLLMLGFLFFRFFDIAKPLGVDKLQALPGGWGILVDDLLAGFYAYLCLETLIAAFIYFDVIPG